MPTPAPRQMRQWHRWEAHAPSDDAFLRLSTAPHTPRPRGDAKSAGEARRMRADAKTLWYRVGSSGFTHGARVAFAVVTSDLLFSPINRAIYYSLRLMFIDRLGLDHSFDFANFIER